MWAAPQPAMAQPMPFMAPRISLPTAETIGDWTRYRDAQGQPYYHNPKLGKTQWEPPDVFKNKPTNPAEQWVEYNTGDKKYYVNVLTGMSTFMKPASIIQNEKRAEELEKKKREEAQKAQQKAEVERAQKQVDTIAAKKPPVTATTATKSSAAAATTTTPTTTTPKTPTPAATATSTPKTEKKSESWVNQVAKDAEEDANKSENTSEFTAVEDTVKKRKAKKDPIYTTKEEAVNAFKSLLSDKGVGEDDQWKPTLSRIISDQRYRALKTLSERKKVFKQYKEELGERMVTEKRSKDRSAREGFMELLAETKDLKPGMSYHALCPYIEKDERFKAVAEESDRAEYLHRYQQQEAKRLKEEEAKRDELKQKKYREEVDALKQALKDDTDITHATDYHDIEQQFIDKNENWSSLREEDVKRYVKRYVKDLQREYDEAQREEREKQKKKERNEKEKKRDAERAQEKSFKEFLKECTRKDIPVFHAKSRWEDVIVLDEFKNDSRFTALSEREKKAFHIFEYFCHDLERELVEDKKRIKRVLKGEKFAIEPTMQVPELMSKFGDHEKITKIDNTNKRLLFLEMIAKAQFRQRERELEKKKKEERDRSDRKRRRSRSRKRNRSRSRNRRRSRDRKRSRSRSADNRDRKRYRNED